MKLKHLLIALLIVILPISLVAGLYLPKGIKAKQHEQKLKLSDFETDHVSVEDVKTKTFVLDDKQPIGGTIYYWKLRSGNQVINFEHVPDHVYWKWNVGEEVPPRVILSLLRIDELIHETYNLHITRQK
ncbi:hypothetical protein [Pedobacter sandarakinus]|uniref:hypothetical protein n=1 Tax=Pedobacter sandarakinus TaxID=353156 RepID=UPI0022470601|nr:hypothetical protein [Pedobacter sandarakinus]MCX2574174.1 hypothetical protein [Pedobacter sandarakinus]